MKTNNTNIAIELDIKHICTEMIKAGISKKFVAGVERAAWEFEGIYDLMKMWDEETDEKERELYIADIQDLMNDCFKNGLKG